MFESPRTRLIRSSASEISSYPTTSLRTASNREMSLGMVLTSLRKYWYVSAIVSSLLMTGIAYKTVKEPKIYKSSVQIAIELKNSTSIAEKISTISGGAGAGVSDDRTMTMDTIVQKLKSKTIVQKAIETIPNPKLRSSVDTVVQNLTIQSGQNNNTLTITYIDTDPQRIVANLNALSSVYIDYGIKTKKARTDNSIAFIESQIPRSRQRLKTASKQLEDFRRSYRFIDPESSAKGLADYRQEVLTSLNENRVKYKETLKQEEQLKKQLTKVGLTTNNTLSTTMLTQDAAYQDLFKKLNELELQYSQEKLRLTEDSPSLISVKEKRDEVLALLKNRAQQVLKRDVSTSDLTNGGIANFGNSLAQNLANKHADIETLLAAQTAQYEGLMKVYREIETQIAQLPSLQQQYTELQRQYTMSSQELTAFLQKLQELKIADAEQVVPWTLLDPPEVPRIPIFPNVSQQLLLGAVGSLALGIGAAVGLNKFRNSQNKRIDNPDTLKAMTGMPILTLVPKMTDLEPLALRGGDDSLPTTSKSKNYAYWSFIESLRMLVLDIGLVNDGQERCGKVLAMTSAVPKEGKSTISFHTSITLAELGYRVLLVDADLHKSTIPRLCHNSELFKSVDCGDEMGLSNVILGDVHYRDVIKKSSKFNNLDVLFSGPMLVNPISLFNSSQFKQQIDRWRKDYDYVIFDTPPIVGVSDTRLIATLVDGLLYVVSMNVAHRRTIDRAIDIISSIPTPVLGLVINRVEQADSGYQEHYQYYQESNKKYALDRKKITAI
jgi:polysaccharide biosynthesis transport protein